LNEEESVKITYYGHACVLLETAEARILVDPGSYSTGFEGLRAVDLILITHAHPDHVTPERLAELIAANPGVLVVTNIDVTATLGLTDARVVATGDSLVEKGAAITVTGPNHAVIHPDLPRAANTGYIIDQLVWHPGDSFDLIAGPVPVLLTPIGGPWMKISEVVEFVRSIGPDVAIPIHQGGLAPVHRDLHVALLKNLGPSGTSVLTLVEGIATEVAANGHPPQKLSGRDDERTTDAR